MTVALALVGASLGAIAVTKGVPLWLVTLMSAVVFAGGSEFMAVGLTAAGAPPLTVLLGGLLLNARHLPFGLAIGGLLGSGGLRRALGSHFMVDESVAFALTEPTPERARRAYWIAGVALYLVWAPSVFLGGLLGTRIGDPAAFGLDAALPAALFALITPSLGDRATARAVAAGALLALLTTPLLPDGMPVMIALLGVAAALPVGRAQADERAEGEREQA